METGAAIDRYSRPKEEDERKRKKRENDTKPLCSQICFLIFPLSGRCSSPVYIYIWEGNTRRGEGTETILTEGKQNIYVQNLPCWPHFTNPCGGGFAL